MLLAADDDARIERGSRSSNAWKAERIGEEVWFCFDVGKKLYTFIDKREERIDLHVSSKPLFGAQSMMHSKRQTTKTTASTHTKTSVMDRQLHAELRSHS